MNVWGLMSGKRNKSLLSVRKMMDNSSALMQRSIIVALICFPIVFTILLGAARKKLYYQHHKLSKVFSKHEAAGATTFRKHHQLPHHLCYGNTRRKGTQKFPFVCPGINERNSSLNSILSNLHQFRKQLRPCPG